MFNTRKTRPVVLYRKRIVNRQDNIMLFWLRNDTTVVFLIQMSLSIKVSLLSSPCFIYMQMLSGFNWTSVCTSVSVKYDAQSASQAGCRLRLSVNHLIYITINYKLQGNMNILFEVYVFLGSPVFLHPQLWQAISDYCSICELAVFDYEQPRDCCSVIYLVLNYRTRLLGGY